MHRNIRALALLAWAVLCLVQATSPLLSHAASRTVWVGIFPLAGFHRFENDQAVGYNVDYLEQVGRYANWRVEYIHFDNWDAALDALGKEHVDLLGGALFLPERAKRFLYSPYANGTTYTALIAPKGTPFIYEDFKNFENLRIGITVESPWQKGFANYASHNGFTPPPLLPYKDLGALRQALAEGSLDAMLTSVIALGDDEIILAKYDPLPFFFITSNSNPALMKELEQAMAQLKLEQPDLENRLARNHLWRSYQPPLTKAERDFVAESPALRVGYNPDRKPMSWLEPGTGEARGVLPDILRFLGRNCGLRFTFVPMNEPGTSLNEYFVRDKIDMCVGVMFSANNKTNPVYRLTSPLLRSALGLYGKNFYEVPPKAALSVAMPKNWNDGHNYVKTNYPDMRLRLFKNTEDCLTAVAENRADLLLQNMLEVDYLLTKPRFRDILSLQGYNDYEDARLAVNATMPPILLTLLNKQLMDLDEKTKSQIISENVSAVAIPLSLSDMVYEHQTLLLALGEMLFFALALPGFVLYLRKKSKKSASKSERRLTNMANNINGGVISLKPNERLDIRNANSGFWHLLDYGDHPPQAPSLADFLQPSEAKYLFQRLENQRQEGSAVNMELSLRRKGGLWIPALLRCTWSSNEHDISEPYLDCVVVDITDQKQMQEELEQEKERYRIILEQSQDIIFDVDTEKGQYTCSPNFYTKFGRESMSLLTLNGPSQSKQIVHPDDIPALAEMRRRVRAGERTVFAVMRMPTSMGRFIWCRVQTTRISKKDAPLRIVGKIVDIDEEVRRRAELERLSQRDSLTDLYNKVAFRERVAQNLPCKPDDENTHALLFLDLDNFKALNDSLGHIVGDAALVDTAEALKRIFRNDDAVGRFGGDEFCVLAVGITRPAMTARAESVLSALSMRFERDGKSVHITASIGIYMFDGSETSYEEALQRADNAQYRAKLLGKNRYVFHDDPLTEEELAEQQRRDAENGFDY
ncbi:MAG: diguanylate cyclase [Desulfovibrio sp.]|nr:diguanylate cyclase [Desulfovibrio sp.]